MGLGLQLDVRTVHAQATAVTQNWPFLNGEEANFGFNVRTEYAVPMHEGAYGAWGVWLEQGMSAG
jgi:hypothetical protein